MLVEGARNPILAEGRANATEGMDARESAQDDGRASATEAEPLAARQRFAIARPDLDWE